MSLIKCNEHLPNEQQINGVPAGVQPKVVDMYTGCRVSPSPLRSGLSFNMPSHLTTQRKFKKMNTQDTLRLLGVPPVGELKLLIFTRVAACHWRHTAAVCVSEGHLTAKTQRKVMNMSNKSLLRVLGISPEGQPRVTDIYTGCRMSLAPLRSGLALRGTSD